MGADNAKNKRMHGWSIHEAMRSSGEARLDPSKLLETQHRGARWGRTRYANNVLLIVIIELFPFRGEPEIPNRELLELATGEGAEGL